jgi:NAD(P)-dependent dehydrogenase (short-subunit alcohol dehydrogenase family)
MQRILITGGSSGLGRAIAEAAAAPGVTMFLGGRDPAKLAASADAVRVRGGVAEVAVVDVQDRAGMAEWIGSCGRLDLVLANAGISGGTGGISEPEAQARRIFAVNVTGVQNSVWPAIALMREQPPGSDGWRGHIGIVASVAAFIAAPHGPAYCASKAAVRMWGEGMAPTLRRDGIAMTVACPGYIATPMTAANRFRMPGLMQPEYAAARILRACREARVRDAFPWWLAAAARAADLLPAKWAGAIMARGPAKHRLNDDVD